MKLVRTLHTGESFVLHLDPNKPVHKVIADVVAAGQGYENATEAFIVEHLHAGDVAVDVGAHLGYFTAVMASRVGPTGQVLAFEPNPDNYKCLLDTIRLNGFKNVTPLQMAVSDDLGVHDLWINKDDDGGHALYPPALIDNNTKTRAAPQHVAVWTTTLTRFLKHLKTPPTLVKIDVEGGEFRVVKGLGCRPQWIVSEIHRVGLEILGSSEAEYRAQMLKDGYLIGIPTPDGHVESLGGRTADGHYVFNVVFERAYE